MTTTAHPTPLSLARPTAPLPQSAAAALSRLESAFPAVLAELHRTERAAAGLRNGESTVINGTTVTAVSLAEAEAALRPTAALPQPAIDAMRSLELRLAPADITAAVATYRKAALRVAALSELADLADAGIELSDMHADDLAHAEEQMLGAHTTLLKADRLDLIGGE